MSADASNVFIQLGRTSTSEILRRQSADSAPADLPASAAIYLPFSNHLQIPQQLQTQMQHPFAYLRTRWCLIRKNKSKIDELIVLILNLQSLSPIQKFLLRTRYVELLISFRRRCFYYSALHRILRLIVSVGSLLVPALLSIQYDANYKTEMYWATWIISLAVTMSNGLFTLFKIDKKYHFVHTITELLWSEGWQYFALTGRYGPAGHLHISDATTAVTHSVMFEYFCHYVEKIKMKQIEEEYYKGIDTDQSAAIVLPMRTQAQLQTQTQTQTQQLQQPSAPNQGQSKLYPFTPDKNIVKTAEMIPVSTRTEIDKFLENMQISKEQQQLQQQQQQVSQEENVNIK